MAQVRMPVFYDISIYLTDKYFEVVWGCPPGDPQKSIFSTAQARVPLFYDISRYLTKKYFDIVWAYGRATQTMSKYLSVKLQNFKLQGL